MSHIVKILVYVIMLYSKNIIIILCKNSDSSLQILFFVVVLGGGSFYLKTLTIFEGVTSLHPGYAANLLHI